MEIEEKIWITVGGSNRKYKQHCDLLNENNISYTFIGSATLGGRNKRFLLSVSVSDFDKCKELGFSKSRRQPFKY